MKRFFALAVLLLCASVLLFACSGGASTKGNATGETQANEGGQTGSEGASGSEPKEQIVLKTISFLPEDHPFVKDIIPMWKQKVEEGTNGQVTVNWIGGPESIFAKEQFDAVRNGIVDVGFIASAYYIHLMPEADSLLLSPYTATEEREKGYFDFLSERFKANNVVYLGRWLNQAPFYFWSNKPIETLEDLKGKKFRANPVYRGIMPALGITPVDIDTPEVYTALERGMVDGFGFPLLGPRESGWTEVTKYIINAPFLEQNCTILMNTNKFESLGPDLQQKLMDITVEFEKEMIEYFIDAYEKEFAALKEAGVQEIKLNEEDTKKFYDLIKEVKWQELKEAVDEQTYNELKQLLYVE
jgi:TRAP-type C4-dicarboxylate transport system substrate-binding protein